MIIGIPTYNREEVKTVEFLDGAFKKDEVIISTQCQDDYQRISAKYGKQFTVIYKRGNCVGDNRNAILEYCQQNGIQRVLMLDDDISSIRTTKRRLKGQEFRCFAEAIECQAVKMQAVLFGCYPNDCILSFKNTITTNVLTGTFLGIMDTSLRFDPKFRIKEDYELSLRCISNGRRVLRFNFFAPTAKHKSKGGCELDWIEGKNEYTEMLLLAYPEYIKRDPRNKNEVQWRK